MNQLHIGLYKNIEPPERGGFLFIDDVAPKNPEDYRARVFDPLKDAFNPLASLDYTHARDLADVLYAVFPQGENTLTVRNGRRALTEIFSENVGRNKRIDKLAVENPDNPGAIEAMSLINDILMSPVLSDVFCRPPNFPFSKNHRIFAKIDRARLGRFDAMVLALVLVNRFQGQVIVNDLGFYGRDVHAQLVYQNRLIAGLNYLDELKRAAPELRQSVLLIKDKYPTATTHRDAEELAEYAGHALGTVGFSDFVQHAISQP